jgi:hypothetical protein
MEKKFKDQGRMLELYDYVNSHPQGLIYGEFANGNILVFKPDCWYEDDNGKELNDPLFEEYQTGLFEIVKVIHGNDPYYHIGNCFEINYHTFPTKIIFDYQI